MKGIHEIVRPNTVLCALGPCEQCIGMYPEHEITDCALFQTKTDAEAEEYIKGLSKKDLDEIEGA